SVSWVRSKSALHLPVTGAIGLFDLLLGKVKCLQIRFGQAIQAEGDPGVFLDFLSAADQALTRTTRQQGNARVYAQNFEDLACLFEITRGHEDQPERDLGNAQPGPQVLGPALQPGLVKRLRPVRSN